MKGKDLKQAKIEKIEFGGKIRPLTFDFNALCELQEDYIDPFVAISGVASGDVKNLRSLLYASLVAGQLATDENEEFDMTKAQVGRHLGMVMSNDPKLYEKIFTVILEGVALFFPDKKEKEEKDKDKTDKKEKETAKN
jgi:hypothetical protein